MVKRQSCVVICALILILAGPKSVTATTVHAQENGLKVTITRPGEGETLYLSSTGPFVGVPVMGWVTPNDFAIEQLQVRLELVQGAKTFASLSTAPKGDNSFSFDVAINPDLPATKSSGEYGCQSPCHSGGKVGLPAGPVVLRVTVVDPLGKSASAERSISVEHSGYADVPVRVVAADNPQQEIGGLIVVAETRLYQWRARQYTARADAKGHALLHVEALTQTPTRYIFHIETAVVDGVLYTSREAQQVTLPPGTTRAEPVILIAATQRGQITGLVDSKGLGNASGLTGLTIRAVESPRGVMHTAKTIQGRFALNDLPIRKYRLAVDEEDAAAQGVEVAPQTIDLGVSPITSATLAVTSAPVRMARGVVRDGGGSPLPFAWITTEDRRKTTCVSPSSGAFALYGLPTETRSLWVAAPGYWSRPIALGADRLDIRLTPQPDARIIPWGSGTVMLPPQTIGGLSGNQLSVNRGWVWGKGTGPLIITTPDLEIELQSGSFALEYLPESTSWFYVREGQMSATVAATGQTIALGADQMLSFGKDAARPAAVDLNDAAVWTLHSGETIPVRIESDPALPSRVRDELQRWGISSVLATSILALVVMLMVVGLLSLIHRWRQPIR